MSDPRAQPAEPVQGFTRNDYTTADKVLGQDVRIEELPEGIRFYLRGQVVNLSEKRIVVNLYELIREDGGLKLRRDFLEKIMNRIPDEDEIAIKYGPSEEGYIWIAKWRDNAGEKGIISETIRISEKWRARYEEAQRKARGADSLPAAPTSAAPVPAAPAAFGPMDMIKILQEGEDRAFRNMERMSIIFKGANGQMPESVMVKAYEAAGSIMERAMESNLAMGKKVSKVVERRMDDEDDLDGAGGAPGAGAQAEADPMEAVPAFIRPFLPQLETWLGTLLGGGPMGLAVKTLIVSSEQWAEIFNDQDKFGQAVAAMEKKFGSDKTQKAMDILLNRRPGKRKGK